MAKKKTDPTPAPLPRVKPVSSPRPNPDVPAPGHPLPAATFAEAARVGVVQATHIGDLKFNPRNARVHNPYNIGVITDSLQTLGAGRSVLIDEHNVLIAGNGTVEAAQQAGMENVLIVDALPDQLVAVRRRGMTEAEKTAMGLVDNRSNETSEWNPAVLREMRDEGVDMQALGFDDVSLQRILAQASDGSFLGDQQGGDQAVTDAAGNATGQLEGSAGKVTFALVLSEEENETVLKALGVARKETPGMTVAAALMHICTQYIEGEDDGGGADDRPFEDDPRS